MPDRVKEIIPYGVLFAVVATLIVHGLLQEIADYKPKVQIPQTKAPQVKISLTKTFTPTPSIKTVSQTPALRNVFSTVTPPLQKQTQKQITVSPTLTPIPSRAVVQSSVLEVASPSPTPFVSVGKPDKKACLLSVGSIGVCPLHFLP